MAHHSRIFSAECFSDLGSAGHSKYMSRYWNSKKQTNINARVNMGNHSVLKRTCWTIGSMCLVFAAVNYALAGIFLLSVTSDFLRWHRIHPSERVCCPRIVKFNNTTSSHLSYQKKNEDDEEEIVVVIVCCFLRFIFFFYC